MRKSVALLLAYLISYQLVEANELFETRIKPILEEKCMKCHGDKKQKSGFRLDTRWNLLKGGHSGETAVLPGDADKSFLIEALTTDDEDMIMPPKGDRLSKEEVQIFREWINAGAQWPGQMGQQVEVKAESLWSLQKIKRPLVPGVKGSGTIDRFIQSSLNEQAMQFSEQAEPRDLIRRVSVILTGLRPSPKDVEEFEKSYEQEPLRTYDQLVDRLLASVHLGERFAQHWLDVIRWGETTGAEANLYRKGAWKYRDYVIDAFNQDLPYDQFIREQLAGDVLGAPYATGFLVAGPNVPKNSIGNQISDHKSSRADRLDQTIQTVSASVLGMTVGCARCHDHKFDPISIEDYYSMKAVFEDLEYEARVPELAPDHAQVILDKRLRAEIGELRAYAQSDTWIEDWYRYQDVYFKAPKSREIRIEFDESKTILDELEIFDKEGRNLLKTEDFELNTQQEGRQPNGPDRSLVDGSYGEWRSFRVNLPKEGDEKPWIEVVFKEPQKIHKVRLSENRELDTISDYITKKGELKKSDAVDNYVISVREKGEWLQVASWKNFEVDRLRNDRIRTSFEQVEKKISQIREEGLKPASIGKFLKYEEKLRSVRRSEEDFISTTGYLNLLNFPGKTHVLKRGDVASPGQELEAAGLAVINGKLNLKSAHAGSERRVEFGKWLSSKQNPLTARTMMNRLWHHVFGCGLVTTGSDFGNAGALPSHPELLDWLAHEFMYPEHSDKAWSVKHMLKLMVSSHAFRQSSLPVKSYVKKDADAIYLWRYNPRRVEAEVMRDCILQVTENLNTEVGGRGFNIYEPKLLFGHWHMKDNFSELTWRRLLYQNKMRRSDDALFSAFDLPDCGQIRDKRSISTTPLQALNLLNAEFVIAQSEILATQVQSKFKDEAAQVSECFRRLFNRAPSEEELRHCRALLQKEGLSLVCRALFNSNEFSLLE